MTQTNSHRPVQKPTPRTRASQPGGPSGRAGASPAHYRIGEPPAKPLKKAVRQTAQRSVRQPDPQVEPLPSRQTPQRTAPQPAQAAPQASRQPAARRPAPQSLPQVAPHAAQPAARPAQPAQKPAAQPARKPAPRPATAAASAPSYLTGLDGLRCIAIFAVLLYHIAPNQFVGGYVGVDFFFVISGLLITYSIIQTVRNPNKSFSLKEYALRRLRRLTPSLVVLVLVIVPLAAVIYPELLVGGLRQVLGGLTYTTNWVEIIHGSDYFDQANPMLLKNLWSVAVEEQFYLIWPPILLALVARKRPLKQGVLLGVAGLLALVSATLMFLLVGNGNFTRVYYGTDTHCFGIALGILLAFVWSKPSGPLSRKWLSSQKWLVALAPAGLIGFIALVMLSPDTSLFTYPFGLFIASVCCLAMVTSVIARPDAPFTRLMELPAMRWLGSRSYGIYLWHWPLLVFGRILIPTAVGTIESLAVDVLFVLISFGIAELNYRFVETPFRKTGFKKAFEDLVERASDGWAGKAQIAAIAALVVATAAALITAPEKTQLQQQIEAMQEQQQEQNAAEDDAQQQNQQQEAPTVSDQPDEGEGEGKGEGEGEDQPAGDTSSIPNYDETQMTGDPDGSTITAIGDSLISGTADGFEAVYPGMNFLAAPIRQWDDAVDVVNEGLEQGVIRQNVILDFGTNGGVRDEALVYQVIDALGPERRIILYNIYSPSGFVDSANELYARIAEERPNVYLGDWASVASAHPEYLNADRTHANMTGMYPFVDVATQAFSQS